MSHILLKVNDSRQSFHVHSLEELRSQVTNVLGTSEFSLRSSSGRILRSISSPCEFVSVHFPLLGGKGGFGSMLRAQGGRMSSKRTTNFMACRDLAGNRVKALKDAQQLAKHLEKQEEREKEKEAAIEKKIEEGLKPVEPKKVLFDDKKFEESHEKAVSIVQDAVAAAFLKKKSKASTAVEFKKKGESSKGKSKDAAATSDSESVAAQ